MTDSTYTPISVETLVLVAVWETPFIFQGSFKILDKSTSREHFFFYRCECLKAHKMEIIEQEFSPYDYHFTHLYYALEQNNIEFLSSITEDALYLLQYALHVTLNQMITGNKQHMAYIDEQALIAISKRIKSVFSEGIVLQENDEIGFAVAMDFNPSEETGERAVRALLRDNRSPDLRSY